jgi:hypothetical protein
MTKDYNRITVDCVDLTMNYEVLMAEFTYGYFFPLNFYFFKKNFFLQIYEFSKKSGSATYGYYPVIKLIHESIDCGLLLMDTYSGPYST